MALRIRVHAMRWFSSLPPRPQVIVIAGPTAVGKSDLAIKLCKQLGKCEFVSADSVQIYRHLDVGTSKPTAKDLATVRHHLVDIREPKDGCSAGEFVREAFPVIEDILARGRIPVVVGGTTMWMDWLLNGPGDMPRRDPESLAKCRQLLEGCKGDWPAVMEILQRYDPERASKLLPNDWYRAQRYLEVALSKASASSPSPSPSSSSSFFASLSNFLFSSLSSPSPISSSTPSSPSSSDFAFKQALDSPATFFAPNISMEAFKGGLLAKYDVRGFFLSEDRSNLYKNIDARSFVMVRVGLLREVTKLMIKGILTPNCMGARAIGYRQAIEYLTRKNFVAGDHVAFELFMDRFATSTRNFAQKQFAHFRKNPAFLWIRRDKSPKDVSLEAMVKEILHWSHVDRNDFDGLIQRQMEASARIQKAHGFCHDKRSWSAENLKIRATEDRNAVVRAHTRKQHCEPVLLTIADECVQRLREQMPEDKLLAFRAMNVDVPAIV